MYMYADIVSFAQLVYATIYHVIQAIHGNMVCCKILG